ncbi:MAG: cellulase family glycosylhydrolase [Armatimonadetes bacterium]|nr:cellulase family glycosylhydrolase [Armatimonadota bacterium]
MPGYFAQKVDPVLKWCGELRLAVTLDSHGAPGNSKEWSDRPLWREERWHENFIRLWWQIARYYRDNRAIVAYELLNEPNMPYQEAGTPTDWNLLARRLTRAIREADKRHTIIVGAADWSNPQGFASLEPTGDTNTLYTFHMYWPHRWRIPAVPGRGSLPRQDRQRPVGQGSPPEGHAACGEFPEKAQPAAPLCGGVFGDHLVARGQRLPLSEGCAVCIRGKRLGLGLPRLPRMAGLEPGTRGRRQRTHPPCGSHRPSRPVP